MKQTALEIQRQIGEAVTKAREAKGMTQQRLASKLKTRQANISRIERGLQNLSLDLLIRLNNALDLNLKISFK